MTSRTIGSSSTALPQADTASYSSNLKVATALICESPLLCSGLKHLLFGTLFDVIEGASSTGAVPVGDGWQEPTLLIFAEGQFSSRTSETIREIKRQFSATRIVALADHFDLGTLQRARDAGVDGVCLTGSRPEVLIKSLELVMLGHPVLPAVLVRLLLDSASSELGQEPRSEVPDQPKPVGPGTRSLSVREAEILGCLADGAPNKVIARKLDVSEATVKVHVKAILRKIGAANRTQAAMWAIQHLPSRADASLKV